MIEWLITQEEWINPILKTLVGFACIKYLLFDW